MMLRFSHPHLSHFIISFHLLSLPFSSSFSPLFFYISILFSQILLSHFCFHFPSPSFFFSPLFVFLFSLTLSFSFLFLFFQFSLLYFISMSVDAIEVLAGLDQHVGLDMASTFGCLQNNSPSMSTFLPSSLTPPSNCCRINLSSQQHSHS